MTSPTGQAARRGVMLAGQALVRLARVAMAVVVLTALCIGAFAWRLAAGPLELPSLARITAEAASTPGRMVVIGHVLVAWRGFTDATAAPLALRLLDVSVRGPAGEASLARADLALPLAPLLRGRIEPETAEFSALRLRLTAHGAPPGGEAFDPAPVMQAMAAPKPGVEPPWARLRHLHVHEASAEMAGVPGRIGRLDVDLDRAPGAGVVGHATASFEAAGQRATLTLDAQVAADGQGSELRAALTPISPAWLAGAIPQAAALAVLEAPVTVTATASLGPTLDLLRAEARVAVGDGTIHAGQGTAPVLGAELALHVTPRGAVAELIRLDTAASPRATPTRFSGRAQAARDAAGGATISAALDVDQVAFADLPVLWPEGTGGPGTRPWMTKNITAGRMTNGHVELDMTVPADLSDVTLRRIDGGIEGHDVTVHWLRPVPPLEHAEARLRVTDPDIIDIAVSAATQAGGRHGGMRYRDATIHLTGIAGRNQFAEIHTGLAGPLADLLAVLNHPRVNLLSKRPLPMRDPSGDVTAQVHVGKLPLRDDVKLDDLVIETTAHVARARLGGIAAGYDLSDGTLDLVANKDALSVDGMARLAGFVSRLKIGMDFRDGPPSQVQERVAASSTIDMARLRALGVPTGQALAGSVELDTGLTSRRDGRTDIALAANLAKLAITEPRTGIAKHAGEPGTARVKVALARDRLIGVDDLRIEAPGISVAGSAELEAGAPVGLRLDRLVLGTGTDLHGEIRRRGPGQMIELHLAGASFDLSPALRGADRPTFGRSERVPQESDKAAMGGQAWRADIAVDRVILGSGRTLAGVRATAESDGAILRRASVDGRAGGRDGAAFHGTIAPDTGGRRLRVDVPDIGGVLRAGGVTEALAGGRLRVTGRWADGVAGAPLAGVAELTEFRVLDAPVIGRVLKALTVYGLVDLLRGPGLGFSSLIAPFSLERGVLALREARAVSPSLGLTARGSIDLRTRRADLTGTVVPAYFFNSLLGRVPLVGRLFTAEKGGGLLAVSVGVTGPLDDVRVRINPWSALAPGALRGLIDGEDHLP